MSSRASVGRPHDPASPSAVTTVEPTVGESSPPATSWATEDAHTEVPYLGRTPTTGLPVLTAYGPWGRPDMARFLFTRAILAGEPIDAYNRGDMLRDFTHVDDVVECISRVLTKPPAPDPRWNAQAPDPARSVAPYRVYDVGSNRPVRLADFITAIEEELGRSTHKNLLPLQPGDVPATWADVDDLVRDFGYRPSTPLRDGTRHLVEWYQQFSPSA
jgi:UDP-glucuronate 4-epimerase